MWSGGLTARVREALVDRTPWLGRYKRMATAAWFAGAPERDTYAQHGEDKVILEMLRDYRLDGGIYVDVGANHPMDISNTYLFYRQGHHGVVVEPIAELVELHRRFRPRDVALCAGCGAEAGVAALKVSKAPVGSSFEEVPEQMLWRTDLVPVVTLDQMLVAYPVEWIYLLSVDVEGRDLDVLRGADETLKSVLLACVEANTDEDVEAVSAHMTSRGFRLAEQISCNLIFENQDDRFRAYRR